MAKNLTPKQSAFCDAYVVNKGNAEDAAIQAGYTRQFAHKDAHTLIQQEAVSKRIASALSDSVVRLGMCADWRLGKLKRIIEAFVPDDINIKLNGRDAKVAVACLAEISKLTGEYAPDRKLSMTVDLTRQNLLDAKKAYDDY